jgi:hypothetical protein
VDGFSRAVIYVYQHRVRLLSPKPVVVTHARSTRVEEPTLNFGGYAVSGDLIHRFQNHIIGYV